MFSVSDDPFLSGRTTRVSALQKFVQNEAPDLAADKVVGAFVQAMNKLLGKAKTLEIEGFGIFTVKRHNKRVGVNPHTGEAVISPAHSEITFTPDEVFEEQL